MTLDELIVSRPKTLTYTRAEKIAPLLVGNPGWNPEGKDGPDALSGCFTIPEPEEPMTLEEAEWIFGLYEHMSSRGVAEIVTGDANQPLGSGLIAIAMATIKKLTP